MNSTPAPTSQSIVDATAAGRTLLTAADAAAQRAAIGAADAAATTTALADKVSKSATGVQTLAGPLHQAGEAEIRGSIDGATTYLRWRNGTDPHYFIGSSVAVGGAIGGVTHYAYADQPIDFWASGSKRFAVNGAGAGVTGDLTVSNGVSIGGNLTSTGTVTAEGATITAGGALSFTNAAGNITRSLGFSGASYDTIDLGACNITNAYQISTGILAVGAGGMSVAGSASVSNGLTVGGTLDLQGNQLVIDSEAKLYWDAGTSQVVLNPGDSGTPVRFANNGSGSGIDLDGGTLWAGSLATTGTGTFGGAITAGTVNTATTPGTSDGQLARDSTDKKLYRWDAGITDWIELG